MLDNKEPKRQILLVEDEPIIAGLACIFLLDIGYDYFGPAYDLHTASLIARNLEIYIDGALLDVKVGNGTSFDVCNILDPRSGETYRARWNSGCPFAHAVEHFTRTV